MSTANSHVKTLAVMLIELPAASDEECTTGVSLSLYLSDFPAVALEGSNYVLVPDGAGVT
jgi:hypothetical protein